MAKASGPLAAYRVLDLTDARGILCGKILGDLGADVVRVEPPGGNPARREEPFASEGADPERSLYWWAYAANSRSLVADLGTPDGAARVRDLAGRADFVLESFTPGHLDSLGLGWDELARENPRLILTSITPFGQTGPYREWKGSDLIVQAMSGMMFHLGDGDRAAPASARGSASIPPRSSRSGSLPPYGGPWWQRRRQGRAPQRLPVRRCRPVVRRRLRG